MGSDEDFYVIGKKDDMSTLHYYTVFEGQVWVFPAFSYGS